jgi:hypothetical protein
MLPCDTEVKVVRVVPVMVALALGKPPAIMRWAVFAILKSFLFSVLVALNHSSVEFPMEILRTLIAFSSDGTPSDLRKYSKQCHNTILAICNMIVERKDSE